LSPLALRPKTADSKTGLVDWTGFATVPNMTTKQKAPESVLLCLLGFWVTMISASAGCSTLNLNVGPPGTIGMQRERAVIHDPYPNPTLGPPIVGGRPAGYDLPLAEAKSLQVNPFSRSRNAFDAGAFVPPNQGF